MTLLRGNGDGHGMWQLHWLEAVRAVPPPRLDILVQRLAGAVIPEIGMVGHAFRKGLFTLTLDPENRHFEAGLRDGTLRRQVAHEVHHCLRMAGPGYGRTLGEALVSEGLAGRFTGSLFGSPAEPWECAVGAEVLGAFAPDAAALQATGYDHDRWFFGVGGRRPRWLGYTLGYQLVGDWLAAVGEVDGDTWVNVPAACVLAAARNRMGASVS